MKLVPKPDDETVTMEQWERETLERMKFQFMVWYLIMVTTVIMAIGYGARAWIMNEPHEWPATILSMATAVFSVLRLNGMLKAR